MHHHYNIIALIGCPFRHWDEGHIQQMLASYGIPMKSIQHIMDYVQSSHYQLACQKYFEVTHGVSVFGFVFVMESLDF